MKKLNFLPLLSVIIIVSCLTACSKLTPENFAKIQNDQTEEQVIQILGKPTKVESGSFLAVTGTSYLYKKNGKEIRIYFMNGKVFSKEGKL